MTSLAAKGLKTCGKCKAVKPVKEFHKRVASVDSLAYKCKDCVNQDTEKWRKVNPGAHIDWYSKNRASRRQYGSAWREKHKYELPAKIAAWSKRNPAKINANISRRRAAKLLAIPSWANLKQIESVYARASAMRKATGQKYEVDHIVPLQGKTVCGLHWEGNLQVLLKADNISKLNRHWPGMSHD